MILILGKLKKETPLRAFPFTCKYSVLITKNYDCVYPPPSDL